MPKLAISYRRSDSSAITGRIFDRLAARYGKESVFMDIDNIPFGADFRAHIQAVLREAEVLIVVIGPRWLGADAAGTVRMSQESDPVRAEIEAALARSMPLIPVLVDGARMPDSGVLPASFKAFSFLNAADVASGRDFHPHLDRLIAAIDKALAARGIMSSPPPAPAEPSVSSARVATAGSAAAPGAWPADLLRYLIAPIVILLAAHYAIVNAYDLGNIYLSVVIVAVPLLFGFLLFWLARRGAAAAIVIALALGIVAESGMVISLALYAGDPIMPETRRDWTEDFQNAATLALSFVAGHALARAAALAMRRKVGT
jgi:hypothetical protein